MTALTATRLPYTGPYSVEGLGQHKGKTALALKRAMSRMGELPWEPDVWDDMFNLKLEVALDGWDPGKDGYAEGRWVKIRAARVPAGQPNAGELALDTVAVLLIRDEAFANSVKVPNLGPVYNGGQSVLQHDLTHPTTNIEFYPAFDDAFSAGTGIIAPEAMRVSQASSANPGDAFYALGASGIKWWFGHVVVAPDVGRAFRKGDLMAKVAYTSQGGGSHCHVGINVENLWGAGQQLEHHTNYTHGAPLIGAQLQSH